MENKLAYAMGKYLGNHFVSENGRIIAMCTRKYDADKIKRALKIAAQTEGTQAAQTNNSRSLTRRKSAR